jgi:hypothetical protein
MELVFNELSFLEYKNSHELFDNFIYLGKLFEKAKTTYGFKHLIFPTNLSVIQVTNDKSFGEWLGCMPTKDRNKVFSIVTKRPFTDEYLGDKKDETLKYYFVSPDLNIEQEYCDGLATADIMNIPSISLKHHSIWENKEIKIYKESDISPTPQILSINNVATEKTLLHSDFKCFCESISIVELIPSAFTYEDKKQNIHFRDDHGIDVLQKFAEKIIKNKYIDGVVNSLPFNKETSRFIRRVFSNGLIEIVLHWEDAGYGMVLKSTGRNYKETDTIANILKEEFDK